MEWPLIRKINLCIYLFDDITCRARILGGGERTTQQMRGLAKKHKSYFVYMLLCNDGSYYTGYTSNVLSRFQRHKRGLGARYTKMRQPKRIAYLERFATRRAAMKREKQMKTLSHDQKRDLAGGHRSMISGHGPRKPLRVT
jgi:putative endonuclease